MKNDKNLGLLEGYRKHSQNNEIEILHSKQCGCFFCRSIFDARKVSDWLPGKNGSTSAVCPECGVDAVIGDASGVPLSKELLKEMNSAFFDGNAVGDESSKAFVDRYLQGKITHNKTNEAKYVKHLSSLARKGEPRAILLLGDHYSTTAEFEPLDYKKAIYHYTDPIICDDAAPMISLARIYLTGAVKPRNKMKGFELLAKAAALGSMEAVYRMADCYLVGNEVETDEIFAAKLVQKGFRDLYPDFATKKLNWDVLPDFAIRMATFCREGVDGDPDPFLAIRYYLLAQFGCAVRDEAAGKGLYPTYEDLIEGGLKELSKTCKCKEGQPIFDADTFFDTYGDGNTPEDGPKTFHLESYDPAELTLSFTIESKTPGFIYDTANLYCAPAPSKIRWDFKDVASFKAYGEGDLSFNLILTSLDGDGWDLVNAEPGNCSTVATIAFTPNQTFQSMLDSLANTPKKKAAKKHPSAKKNPDKK